MKLLIILTVLALIPYCMCSSRRSKSKAEGECKIDRSKSDKKCCLNNCYEWKWIKKPSLADLVKKAVVSIVYTTDVENGFPALPGNECTDHYNSKCKEEGSSKQLHCLNTTTEWHYKDVVSFFLYIYQCDTEEVCLKTPETKYEEQKAVDIVVNGNTIDGGTKISTRRCSACLVQASLGALLAVTLMVFKYFTLWY